MSQVEFVPLMATTDDEIKIRGASVQVTVNTTVSAEGEYRFSFNVGAGASEDTTPDHHTTQQVADHGSSMIAPGLKARLESVAQ